VKSTINLNDGFCY